VSNEHVDVGALNTLREVMEGEYATLLGVFIKDSEGRVRDLNHLLLTPGFAATSQAHLQQLAMMAHSFKGSSGNMGATQLADLCRDLEDIGRGHVAADDDRIRSLVQAIEAEFRIVRGIFELQLQACPTDH
jgi:HPt (histidine-containing phosphotransfer) domain-containing protein